MEDVRKEISYFYKKYNFNILYVHDELFFVKKAKEFCRMLRELKKELNADFDWGCYLRVNDAKIDLLMEIKETGCQYVGYGFESASDKVLKSMKKGTTAEKILHAIRVTEEAGIGLHANFIFGDVAETPQTISETVEFYNKYCKDLPVYFYYITPYPGSALFDYCIENNIIGNKQEYYETVAHTKGYLNMTKMPDDVFRQLTEPVMSNIYDLKPARVLSCKKTDDETCDRNAPFELRRTFYNIIAICPHCSASLDYLYPLGLRPGVSVKPFLHYCTDCHKTLLLDVSKQIDNESLNEDPYLKFFEQSPYVEFYPFDSSKYVISTIPVPQLLESYKGFNIIRYANYIYAMSQALGALDITQLEDDRIKEYQHAEMCYIAHSVEEVKSLI